MMPRYIDAEKLMHTLGIADECKKCTFCIGAICTNESDFVDACTAIAEAPTADVQEVKHGKWVEAGEYLGELRFKCSACQKNMAVSTVMLKPVWNFCPNCGADMRERREECEKS